MDSINVQTDSSHQKVHVIDSVDLLVYLVLLAVAILTTWIFKRKRFPFLHESGLSVVLGLIIGAVLRFAGKNNKLSSLDVVPSNNNALGFEFNNSKIPDILKLNISGEVVSYGMVGREGSIPQVDPNDIKEKATFDPEIFFYVILPPIIFNAGYSMRKKHFFNNFGSIITFAMLGTVISTFVIACIMWVLVQMITTEMVFLDTLYFGAIVSATDPVTVLAIFSDLNVDPMLNGLVLGESLLNDAVSLVLCRAIENYSRFMLEGDPNTFDVGAFFRTIGIFFGVFFGSVCQGTGIGAITALLIKFTRIRDFPILETSLFFLVSYSSYLIAEICEMSGIVSVLFCGIFQAHYTFHNLSLESRIRTRHLFDFLNFLMENLIFSYIGVSMFTFTRHRFNFLFIIGAIFALAISRALNIYPLSLLLNIGRSRKIPLNYQHMLWFSGLRGAMSFALAMTNTVSEPRQIFLTTTSLISILTVIFCGGFTTPLLSILEIPVGGNDGDERENSGQPATQDYRSSAAKFWKSADRALFKPLFTVSQPTLQETLGWLGPVARWLTTEDQMAGRYVHREDPESELVCYSRDAEVGNSNPRQIPPMDPALPNMGNSPPEDANEETENSLSCGD